MGQVDIQKLDGRQATSGEESYLYFMGTAYLGIPYHPVFKKALKKGIQLYGTNFGSSRLGNLSLSVYKETECLFCDWLGTTEAITFSSGYLAGQALMAWVEIKGFEKIRILGDHPALWSNSKSPMTSSNQFPLEPDDIFINHINSKPDQSIVILTTSVDPMLGKIYSFNWIEKIQKEVFLAIDDSHGLGILGKEGKGILDLLPINPKVKILLISSLGKALGFPGGLISGEKTYINEIRKGAIFSSSSPISPAYLCAFLYSQHIYSSQRESLWENIEWMKSQDLSGFSFSGNHPIIPFNLEGSKSKSKGRRSNPYEFLKTRKILISSFPYPLANDIVRNRIVLNAMHKRKDLKVLTQELKNWK